MLKIKLQKLFFNNNFSRFRKFKPKSTVSWIIHLLPLWLQTAPTNKRPRSPSPPPRGRKDGPAPAAAVAAAAAAAWPFPPASTGGGSAAVASHYAAAAAGHAVGGVDPKFARVVPSGSQGNIKYS